MNLDRVKDTIAKLLNLAKNDAATEGEVNNAMRFARKLMNEHHLTEEDCVEQDLSPEERVARATCAMHSCFSFGPNMANWEGTLAVFVTQFVGGVKVFRQACQDRRVNGIVPSGKTATATKFNFYGIDEDAAYAVQLFGELCMLIAAMARLKWGGVFRGPGRAYAEAFVSGLYEQIRAADAEQSVSDSRALVVRRNALVAAKESRAVAFLKETQGDVKLRAGARGGGRRHYEAEREGRADGRAANLAGRAAKLNGGGQRRLN